MKRIRGERIKNLREDMRLTQEDLALQIGVGVQQINRYENQKTEPDADIVARLADALGVSSDYLLGLSDNPIPPNLNASLNTRERAALLAWRRGERMEAIRVIAGDE